MLDIMKKFLYIISLIIVATLLTPISAAYAQQYGDQRNSCVCKDAGNSPDYECTSGVTNYSPGKTTQNKCDGNKICMKVSTVTISCQEKPTQQNTQVKCKCENPGKLGAGNNGMICEDGQGRLGVTIYCDPGHYVCVEGADKSMNIGTNSKINERNYDPYDQRFINKPVAGITCMVDTDFKKTQGVQCTCDPNNQPESGKNGFTCTGIDNKQYQMWCGDEDQQCLSDSKGNYVLSRQGMKPKDGQDTDDFKKNMEGTTARNIRCESEKDRENTLALTPGPTDPPPPLPPCANNSISTSGKCNNFFTALGEMGTNAPSFTRSIFAILLSFSGGLALLLIIRSGYTMMTSQGNPQKIQEGRDQLVAAIVGLVFLIFSFVLLQLIGYDLLRIPGFGADGGQGTGTVNSKVKGG